MHDRAQMRGYVLAGGRSTRMGTDKADVVFAGAPMLEIAAATMATVCDEVTIVGVRDQVPAGTTCIPDVYPGCGPMGGIAAALRDCRQKAADFAVFLPVDMPLLPGGLLRSLTEVWSSTDAIRVALAVADGRVQPLVSMIHVDVAATLDAALVRGDHKLQPALRESADSLAEASQVPSDAAFFATSLAFSDRVGLTAAGKELSWSPTAVEWDCRSLWFANLNTQSQLQEALAHYEKAKMRSSHQEGKSISGNREESGS